MPQGAVCCWCGETLVPGGPAVYLCPTPACQARQLTWRIQQKNGKGELKDLYVPTPRQVEFHESRTKHTLFGGAAGPGKAVQLNTVIPTPTGYATMETIGVGDTVFSDTGAPCTVTAKSAVHVDPTGTYRLQFDDGTVVVTGGAHQWLTWTAKDRMAQLHRSASYRAQRRATRASRAMTTTHQYVAALNTARAATYVADPVTGSIRETQEIARTLTVRGGMRTNHSVPLGGVWEMPDQTLPIDPYVLGIWLGDGDSAGGIVTTPDPEVLYECEAAGYPTRKIPSSTYRWRLVGLTAALRPLGVLKNKHVPASYLWASPAQRLALLQGLMDSDGTCTKDAGCVFTSVRRNLAEAVQTLTASLGLKPHWADARSVLNGRDCGPSYEVSWTGTVPVFRLSRKAAGLPTRLRSTQSQRYIVRCDRIADQPVQCLTVDAPSHRFLIGAVGIPTQNSHSLRWDLYTRCLRQPGYEALLLRRTFPELEKTHIRKASRDAPMLGAVLVTSEHVIRFSNGSLLEFGHCDNDGAISKYLSTEYDCIAFDELVTFERDVALEIMTRARTSKPGLRAMVKCGSNPGGVGALWVLDFFIDKRVDPERYPFYKPEDWGFVPANLDDNPYRDAEYEQALTILDPARYEQLRFGNWRVFDGQMFGIWDERKHVVDMTIQYPAAQTWFCSMDWGFNAPGVCLWWIAASDGHYLVVDELKFKETAVRDVARAIKEKSKALGLKKVPQVWADPAIWQRHGQVGEAIAETFLRLGVPVTRSNNDRMNGWQRLQEMLRDAPDGRPWLQVERACRYLIRTLPAAVRDKTNPEDLDTAGDDHCLDAARYGAMSRRRFTGRAAQPNYEVGTMGALVASLRPTGRRVLGTASVQGVSA